MKLLFCRSTNMEHPFSSKNTAPIPNKMDTTVSFATDTKPEPTTVVNPDPPVPKERSRSRSKTPSKKSPGKKLRKTSVGEQKEVEPLALPPAVLVSPPDLPPPILPEPLLQENPDRFVIFPIKHPDLWAKYKQHMAVFWTPEEIDLSKDMRDWEKLTENELLLEDSGSHRRTSLQATELHG